MATKVKLIADGVITPDQITLTTASTGTNTTAPATTAFVQQEISALVDSSPDALNTLNELAAALGDDANFSTTVTNSIATKLPLAGGTLTGTLNINNSSGFGNIELGGSSGGYVDFKTPFSDDYDARIIYPGSYLQISTSSDEPILLKHNDSEKLRTTSTGIDVTGNATFDDDGKALFGAGFDLQIYHNGSNSFIDEIGTGILYIRAATDLRLTNRDSSKLYANFEDGGASKLYHDNALSIFTTSTGATIYEALTVGSSNNSLGTTAGDQLTPLTLQSDTANGDFLLFTTKRLADGTNWTTAAHRIQRKVDTTKMGYIQFGSNADDLITFGESETEYMRIDGSGNVGIGTVSPDTIMEIRDADPVLTIRDSSTGIANANATLRLAESGASDTLGNHFDIGLGNNGILSFGYSGDGTAATEQMRLVGSTGNFGIGTDSPADLLDVRGDGADTYIRVGSDTAAGNDSGRIGKIDSSTDFIIQASLGTTSSNTIFKRNTTVETMRIRDDGGIAIGENNTGYAGQILSVKSGTGDLVMYGESSDASCGISLRDNSSSLNITWAAEGNDHVLKKDATVYMRVYASDDNLALGHIALESNTSGVSNTGIGSYTLRENTSGGYNTAIGAVSLRDNLTGSNLTAVGYGALVTNTASNNTAVGYKSLHVTTTGESNVAVGSSALLSNTTGSNNVAIGQAALDANTTASQNVAIGRNALTANTTASNNTAVGDSALGVNTTGAKNVAVGALSLDANTEGEENTAVGYLALSANTTADANTAFGVQSLMVNTTGSLNAAFGAAALDANTTGSNNTAMGYGSLTGNTTASNNTAVGYFSLLSNTTGADNNAFGANALDACTTGGDNNAFGRGALGQVTTGIGNTAFGHGAVDAVTTGSDNVGVGRNALSNVTAGGNVAVGYRAGFNATTADDGVYIGYRAGYQIGSQDYLVAIGKDALYSCTSGQYNVAVGYEAGQEITSGSSNTTLGYRAGDGITTGGLNTLVGIETDASSSSGSNQIVLGYQTIGHGDNKFTFGQQNGNSRVYNAFQSNASWTRVSDERYKEEIEDNTDCGLDFINDLRPVTFKWKAKADIDNTLPDYHPDKTERQHDEKMYGLIAQEVKEAMDNHNITDFGGWDIEESSGIQSISQEMFIHPLIKAVQELSSQVDELKAEIQTLKGE